MISRYKNWQRNHFFNKLKKFTSSVGEGILWCTIMIQVPLAARQRGRSVCLGWSVLCMLSDFWILFIYSPVACWGIWRSYKMTVNPSDGIVIAFEIACRCHACRQMLPTFCNLSNDYPNSLFIYTDIDECPEETQDVRYTPTFRFYRGGERVDEFYGAGPQRLRDRVWLQAWVDHLFVSWRTNWCYFMSSKCSDQLCSIPAACCYR